MPCGLLEEELFLLNRMYVHRNFKPESAENYDLLKSAHNRKQYPDFDGMIRRLKQKGFIAQTPKRAGLKLHTHVSKRTN